MITILEIEATQYTTGARKPVRAALIGDTTADLPGVTDISGYTLIQGTTCIIIQDSALYRLRSNGTWVQQLQDISADTYTKSQINSMITAEENTRSAADTALQNQINTKISISDIYGVGSGIITENSDKDNYAAIGVYIASSGTIAA